MPGISLVQTHVAANDAIARVGERQTGSEGNRDTRSRIVLAALVALMAAVLVGAAVGQAVRGTQALGATDLGALNGADGRSSAAGTDSAGDVVVGTSTTAATFEEAFRWDLSNATTGAGVMTDLGNLQGPVGAQGSLTRCSRQDHERQQW